MEKLENIDSEHLLGDDLKKGAKKAETSNGMFERPSNQNSSRRHSKFKSYSGRSQNIFFCMMDRKLH